MGIEIIIKNKDYRHINRSLPGWDTPHGKRIYNERHYREECKKAGLVPFKEAESMMPKQPKLKPTKDCKEILSYVQTIAKSDGSIKLSGRAIDKMVKMGAIKRKGQFDGRLPEHYRKSGGFINE